MRNTYRENMTYVNSCQQFPCFKARKMHQDENIVSIIFYFQFKIDKEVEQLLPDKELTLKNLGKKII